MALHILLYTILGCLGMAVQDIGGTYLNLAENRGKEVMAARLDVLCDAAKFLMFSFSGEKLMSMGWEGWLGIPFILTTGYWSTKKATRRAYRDIR